MKRLLTIAFGLWIALPVWGQQPIEYQILLSNPQTQTVDIQCEFSDLSGESLELKLPVWRPGKYQILDPAGTLYDFRAETGDGEPLVVRKTDKSTWRVMLNGSAAVRVSYRIYANSLGDRTRHVDDSHAFLSGSSIFVYSPSYRSHPLTVSVSAPKEWEVATGLSPVQGHERLFYADDYDTLVDSPFEIGIQTTLQFESWGRPHEIVIWGEADYDPEKLVRDFKRIVEDQVNLWGKPSYDRYVFLIHIGPGFRGGTEHLNSTIMQTSREQLEDEAKYKEFLGLVSHEFFHTWNIKQIRPSGLSPYHYHAENYTSLLWLVEGTTSYYDDLCLARTGLIDQKEYLKRLSSLIDGYRRTPGRAIQSLAESSFDAWIKFTHPTPHSRNTTVSFYSKGALVSLLLDFFIREHSGGQTSMDELLRRLYRDYPLDGAGYQEEDLRSLTFELSGKNPTAFFDAYVRGVDALPFEKALESVGLKLALDQKNGSETGAYLGVVLKGTIVSAVLSDGPSYSAGLIAGDEIMALNSRRLLPGTLTKRLEAFEPGETIEISFFRRGLLRVLAITLGEQSKGKWTISVEENPTNLQKQAYERWMHQPWDTGESSNE